MSPNVAASTQAAIKVAVCHPKSEFRMNPAWRFDWRWLEPKRTAVLPLQYSCATGAKIYGKHPMEAVDFSNMRRAMVDSQLRTSGVTDAWVLAAMGELRREDFVPAAMREVAYNDRSVALADGGMLNPPVATALMLQAAEVTPSDHVLFVGTTGSYAAAILATRAKVTVVDGQDDIANGSFSVIFIDGAVEEVPKNIVSAAKDGARIVTGLAERGVTSLASGIVRGGKVALRRFADSEIAVLPQFARKPEFVF
jgi:protein-L-isoaspartate(D-aspartate) O-methyltransferase